MKQEGNNTMSNTANDMDDDHIWTPEECLAEDMNKLREEVNKFVGNEDVYFLWSVDRKHGRAKHGSVCSILVTAKNRAEIATAINELDGDKHLAAKFDIENASLIGLSNTHIPLGNYVYEGKPSVIIWHAYCPEEY